MATIIVRTVGNPSLNAAHAMTRETRHRTARGAVRQLVRLRPTLNRWAEARGAWGHVEIEVNGVVLADWDLVGEITHVADTEPSDVLYDEARAERVLAHEIARIEAAQ